MTAPIKPALTMGPTHSITSPAASPDAVHKRLRQATDGMQGMFLRQLFSAMRASVTSNGDGLGSSTGNTVFTQMLDDALADRAATQMRHGLGDALYKQLAGRITNPGDQSK